MECADKGTPYASHSTEGKILFNELVKNIFKELNNNGQTIILITHEDSIAKQSNRIITIMDGLIKSDLRE